MCGFYFFFFFFKQKTAYEMRISDWSSDVCSSDLFMAAFCLVSVRLLAFALFDTSAGHRSGATAFVPARADIVDRTGVPLARTIDGYSIRVVPSKLLNDRPYLATELGKTFPELSRDRQRVV